MFRASGGGAAEAQPGPPARDRTVQCRYAQRHGDGKKATEKGLVVVGREAGQKDKEWAFVLDAGTRIEADGKSATALREGDAVTVTYTNRDGKIVAQSVKVKAP